MSNKEQKIKEEIEKTLSAFKEIKNIEANAFMFTRIKAEIESPVKENRIFIANVKAKLFPASLFVLFLLNAISLTYYFQNHKIDSLTRKDYVTSFAKQYSLTTTDNDFSTNLFKGE